MRGVSKIYNQAAFSAIGCPKAATGNAQVVPFSGGCPKAAKQAMHMKCLSAMGCPKAAEQGMQTPFCDHIEQSDHIEHFSSKK